LPTAHRNGQAVDIFDFEDFISSKILERGRHYFEDDRVKLLRRDEDGWSARVIGSKYYKVSVSMTDEIEIDDAVCDCPYDAEAYCKHTAATLYAIRENTICDAPSQHTGSAKPKKHHPDISVEEILDSLEKPVLVSLLREFTYSMPALRDEIIFRYRDKHDDSVDAASYAHELMESSIIDASDGEYIDWYSLPKALEGVGKAQKLAQECLKKNDWDSYTEINITIIETMLALRDSCDSEAYDDIEDIIGYSIDSLEKGLKKIPSQNTDERRRLFSKVFDHALSPRYGHYEIHRRYELLKICIPLVSDESIMENMSNYLYSREQALKSAKDDYYIQEERECIQNLRRGIIAVTQSDKAAISYMEKHLDNEGFRKALFEEALKAGDLQKALKLCRGEDSSRKLPRPLSGNWKIHEHDVYVLLHDRENQRNTARDLFVSGYGQGLEYYLEFKALTPQKEWLQQLDDLLKSLQEGRGWGLSRYLEVLKHEELKDRIMEYCRGSKRSVFSLYSYLLPHYEDEVDTMFVEAIEESARAASTRKHYAELRGKLSCYGAAMDLDKARRLRDSILAEYPRKPALREELTVL
jgi:hypothetical protein